MRPLHKMPAGILLPLAELILGKEISPSAEGDQGAALDLQALKGLTQLLYHDRPTLCVKLALAQRSRKQTESVCELSLL